MELGGFGNDFCIMTNWFKKGRQKLAQILYCCTVVICLSVTFVSLQCIDGVQVILSMNIAAIAQNICVTLNFSLNLYKVKFKCTSQLLNLSMFFFLVFYIVIKCHLLSSQYIGHVSNVFKVNSWTYKMFEAPAAESRLKRETITICNSSVRFDGNDS